jgi:twinkle protein
MKTYSDYGIEIPPHKVAGEVVVLCPECSHTRKKKRDKCLSVNLTKRVWFCSHCGWKGGLPSEYQQMQKTDYKKPQPINKTGVSEKVVNWFKTRGINQETLNHFKIVDQLEFMPQASKEVNTILFQYFRQGELINIKYRDGAKNFKLAKEAELIFYNLDGIKDFDECYIVEGEMDCLSLWQSGIINVLSVPNGANLKNNTLLYLDNSLEFISHIKRFHIATDNDIAGRQLREDLALRLGKENCDYIVFGQHKDANECLLSEGYDGIQKYVANKIEFPLEGVFSVEDYSDEIDDFYYNGLPIGAKIGIPEIDELISFHKGYICGITGIPSHGKTSLLDDWLVRLSITENWKCAYYSPENKPTKLHFSKIARLYTGKFWDGENRMTYNELQVVKGYTKDRVWFIKPEKDFTLDSILLSVKQLILQRGIDCFVIDAWNKLEHKEETTGYVGKQLDKLADFCEVNNVICFLVAHPTKMKKTQDGLRYEVPTLYDIAGSANFYNKIDLGICVYRDFTTNITTLIVQKVKFNHWGKTGSVNLNYSMPSGRYSVDGQFEQNLSWLRETQNHGLLAKIFTTALLEYEFKNEPSNNVIQSKIDLTNPWGDSEFTEPPF